VRQGTVVLLRNRLWHNSRCGLWVNLFLGTATEGTI
jgi:hypothetical protein